MVGITYTGLDGKTTSFMSNSAEEAMTRLESIKGYRGGFMEAVGSQLASGFNARRRNASRIDALRTQQNSQTRFANGAQTHSTGNSVAAKMTTVTDVVRDQNGNLIKVVQDNYVSRDGGSIVSVGNRREEKIREV